MLPRIRWSQLQYHSTLEHPLHKMLQWRRGLLPGDGAYQQFRGGFRNQPRNSTPPMRDLYVPEDRMIFTKVTNEVAVQPYCVKILLHVRQTRLIAWDFYSPTVRHQVQEPETCDTPSAAESQAEPATRLQHLSHLPLIRVCRTRCGINLFLIQSQALRQGYRCELTQILQTAKVHAPADDTS